MRLRGVVVPMVTPFDEKGRVDEEGIRRLVEFLIGRGVHALFPCGTTGEGPLLSLAERKQVAKSVVDAVGGRVPVIVHTGAITTDSTFELTKHAASIGADAAAILPPYFYHLSEDALLDHYVSVASAVPDSTIFLYNFPAVTNGNALTPDLIRRIVERCPNIVGIKDSSGSLDTVIACASLLDGAFNTAMGSDKLMLAAFAMGVDASVSGNANAVPELAVSLYKAISAGDIGTARRCFKQMDLARRLLGDGDLALLKGVLAQRGITVGQVRRPLARPEAGLVRERWVALAELGLDPTPAHSPTRKEGL